MPETIRDTNTGTKVKVDEGGYLRVTSYTDGAVISSTNPLPVYIGTAVDIQVGAVEIKDATTGDRANVGLDSSKYSMYVQSESLANSANQSLCAIDSNNSTSTLLGIDGVFTGTAIDVSEYNAVYIQIYSDKSSAVNGVKIQTSTDNVNWEDHNHPYTLTGGSALHLDGSLLTKYYRISYTNGTTAQTVFRLQSKLLKTASNAHTHPIEYTLTGNHPAAITRSILVAKNPGGTYGNINRTNGGNLKISVEEWEADVINYANMYPAGPGVNGSVSLTNANTAYALPTTAPTNSYVLNLQNQSDTTIYIGYANSTTNGMALYSTGDIEEKLGPSQQMYAYCGTSGKVITYTLKEVQ